MLKEEKIKKILFLSHQGIGDLLLSLPIYEALSKCYPEAVITSTVKSEVEKGILQNQTLADSFILSNYHEMSFMKKFVWVSKFILKRYDLIIAPVGSNLKYAVILRIFSVSKRLVAPINNGSRSLFVSDPIYVSEKAKRFFNNQRISSAFYDTNSVPRLKVNRDLEVFNNYKLKERVFGIHPGSGEVEKHKRWPSENFVKLINLLLKDADTSIFLFGVKSEIKICNSILEKIDDTENIYSVCGQTTFDESLVIINKCDFFISADSGMMHAAAALNVRTVSIFGPTSHGEIAPDWNEPIILTKDLPCSPCYPYFLKGCGNPRCMSEITPEYVYQVLGKIKNDKVKKEGRKDKRII